MEIPTRFRFTPWVLAGSIMIMGGCGIVYEYTLGALGNNLIGSSHEQIFVIIGLMMFAMGIGATLQRNITGLLLDKFLLLEILLGLVGGVSALVIYATFAYTTSYRITMYGFAMLIGVLIGLEIPMVIRINAEYSKNLRTNLSQILCMDYVGALAGALLFTYVFLSTVSMERITLVIGGVNMLIGIAGLLFFWPLVRWRHSLMAFSFAGLLILGLMLARADSWMSSLEQRCFRDPIILSETSRYQHVVMTKRNDTVSLFLNGQLQFCSKDEEIYHEMLVHVPMSGAKNRRRVLILGGGDGLALRDVLRYGDVEHVTLVDLDPLMTELATTHPELIRMNESAFHDPRLSRPAPKGIQPGGEEDIYQNANLETALKNPPVYRVASVQVLNVDADQFVRGTQGPFDVVLIDFPDPRSIELAKLYSVDFYQALKSQLAPDAIVSIQSASPYHARKVFLCIGKTLREAGFNVLPYRQNVPSFGEWGWHLAWRSGETPEEMKQRLCKLQSFQVPTRYLTVELLPSAFAFGKGWLDTEEIRPNSKLRPVILKYYRIAWERG
ncbi:polyamine aminopropyltransferase [Planctomycetota bacterium]